eukprot:3604086-Rhodomonas_salina.3
METRSALKSRSLKSHCGADRFLPCSMAGAGPAVALGPQQSTRKIPTNRPARCTGCPSGPAIVEGSVAFTGFSHRHICLVCPKEDESQLPPLGFNVPHLPASRFSSFCARHARPHIACFVSRGCARSPSLFCEQ